MPWTAALVEAFVTLPEIAAPRWREAFSPEVTEPAVTATLFVANPGTGLDRVQLLLSSIQCRLRLGHLAPNHERAGGADVDRTQVPQLLGQLARSEGPVPPDVDPSEENH